jgi:hypothetical protein
MYLGVATNDNTFQNFGHIIGTVGSELLIDSNNVQPAFKADVDVTQTDLTSFPRRRRTSACLAS